MIVREVARILHDLAPRELAERWDNIGLICGDYSTTVTGIAICLDVTPEVITSAAQAGCNLLISHHPVIFGGIKYLRHGEFTSDCVMALVKRDISCIAAHTNLDFVLVSRALAEIAGARVIETLSPIEGAKLAKLVVFVPHEQAEAVRDAMFNAGAGCIGNYSSCSFSAQGVGTFRGDEGTNPFIGTPGKLESAQEIRIETVLPQHRIGDVVRAMKKAHPYEEVAYDLIPLLNEDNRYGNGVVAVYDKPMSADDFITRLKDALSVEWVEVAGYRGQEKVRRVAFAAGAGFDCYSAAVAKNCDAFVTGEAKYSDLFQPNHRGVLTVIAGHGQSEAPVLPLLKRELESRLHDVRFEIIPPKFPANRR